ncbi:acetyl-CoA synthetase-like protein [Anaeromyces robustus]|uniref:Acetyl-CoA synthetase-like protein n=1 Tax=Anaeromyces robustus TaxID=1754192 RepID=A0A1Y1XMR4_9FUNG|nr:acetyl-CoA synthetase-like protein [Anaeromyces robustus]|eukprot:ORX87022.1 acetyl-CoA synthetase-like protein [Anaeromyces robustus]
MDFKGNIDIIHEFNSFKTTIPNRFKKYLLNQLTNNTIINCFRENNKSNPLNSILKINDKEINYLDFENESNKIAKWLLSINNKPKDKIGIIFRNSMELLLFIIAIQKIGATAVLFNNEITESKLMMGLHEINITTLITEDIFTKSTYYKLSYLIKNFYVFSKKKEKTMIVSDENHEKTNSVKIINPDEMKLLSSSLPSDIFIEQINVYDIAIIHYSNTGKTTEFSHKNIITHSDIVSSDFKITNKDYILCTYSLTKNIRSLLNIFLFLTKGVNLIIIREENNFNIWNHYDLSKATIINYSPLLINNLIESNAMENHKVRLIIGTSISKNMQERIKTVLKIPNIGLYYISINGKIMLSHLNNIQKSNIQCNLGSPGIILKQHRALSIIKVDGKDKMPIRDENGLCIECKENEPGELIKRIENKSLETAIFLGEVESDALKDNYNSVFLKNVFMPGDIWYRTRDLFKKDKKGYLYYLDALKNCYTLDENIIFPSLLSDKINSLDHILESSVYGINNPTNKTKSITMCNIIVSDDFNLNDFTSKITQSLNPNNGLPMFLKINFGSKDKNTYKILNNDTIEDLYQQQVLDRKPDFELYWLIERVINKTKNNSIISVTKNYEYSQFQDSDFKDVLMINLKPKL